MNALPVLWAGAQRRAPAFLRWAGCLPAGHTANRSRLGRPGTAPGRDERGEIWALREVTCDVAHGEVVGIVGRNGAGKSTLLKILSRITEPSEGGATIRGRVASLLEVGTGFHPDSTREPALGAVSASEARSASPDPALRGAARA